MFVTYSLDAHTQQLLLLLARAVQPPLITRQAILPSEPDVAGAADSSGEEPSGNAECAGKELLPPRLGRGLGDEVRDGFGGFEAAGGLCRVRAEEEVAWLHDEEYRCGGEQRDRVVLVGVMTRGSEPTP